MEVRMELRIDGVTKQYKNIIAVDRVTETLPCGIYGLLGENGAGKTTLMRMICGILEPSEGESRLDGRDIRAMGEEYRELLGYLPQDFGYYLTSLVIEIQDKSVEEQEIQSKLDLLYLLCKNYTQAGSEADLNTLKDISTENGIGFYERRMEKVSELLNTDTSVENYFEQEKNYWMKKAQSVSTTFRW
jgi:ABC-type uncharacterized transport system ATPase subunit